MVNNKKIYDIIISGAGAAGLLLAFEISSKEKLRHLQILLIDPVRKSGNDRTWCFWSKQKTPFDHLLTQSWDRLEFLSESFSNSYQLAPYKYKMLQSAPFYDFIWDELDKNENITFLQAEASEPSSREGIIEIVAAGKTWQGRKLFDSRLKQGDYSAIDENYNLILQHFKGYVIETPEDAFDVETVRMFDFRLPQNDQVRFVYILPITSTKALVEFTVFSPEMLAQNAYDEALQKYISDILKLDTYKILEEEKGVIPMTDFPFKREMEKGIFKIGTQGGMCKPSTGYAFTNMWKDASIIANQLEKNMPINLNSAEKRFKLYDALLLDIIKKEGGSIANIFSDMFRNNKIQRIFKFLNEETTPIEDLQVMWSVPSKPFLKAIVHLASK